MESRLYRWAWYIVKFYFKLVHRWEIKGKENQLAQGPLIVMANHISFLDPPLIACAMERQVYFMAKEELFKNPLLGWFLGKIGTFPVKRGRPDRLALKKSFQVLKEGKVLGIFPEGTRYQQGKLGKIKLGAVMIAVKTKAPILPAGIKIKDGKQIAISFGKAFTLDDYYDQKLSKEELQAAGELIKQKIAQELDRI